MTKYAFIASEFIDNMIPSLYFNNNQQLYCMHFFKNITDDALLSMYQEPRHLVYYAVSHCTLCSILFHCIANLAKSICSENPCLYQRFMSIFYGLSTWFSKANQSDCETEPNFLNAALCESLFQAKYNFSSHIFHRVVLKGKEEPNILLFEYKWW